MESAVLTPEWGIETDAHGGSWHRQVSLLSAEKIEQFRKKLWVEYGAFGENLVVEGFDLRTLPVPSRLAVGGAVLELTQIGKECHNDCAIRQKTGDCIMPREGVFARVVQGGIIRVGGPGHPAAPAGRATPAGSGHHPVRQGQSGQAGGQSGPLAARMLTEAGYRVEEALLLPDDAAALRAQLLRLADGRQVNLILTTGGTGFSPRDVTPEATLAVADRNAPGIAEALRSHSLNITPGDAQPGRQRPAGEDPDRQPARQPQGGGGGSGVSAARAGTRPADRRRSGRRVCPDVKNHHFQADRLLTACLFFVIILSEKFSEWAALRIYCKIKNRSVSV